MPKKVLDLTPRLERKKKRDEEERKLRLLIQKSVNGLVTPQFAIYFSDTDSIFTTPDDRQLKNCIVEPSCYADKGSLWVSKSLPRTIVGFKIYRVSSYVPGVMDKKIRFRVRALLAQIELATGGFETIFGKDSEAIKNIVKKTHLLPAKLP